MPDVNPITGEIEEPEHIPGTDTALVPLNLSAMSEEERDAHDADEAQKEKHESDKSSMLNKQMGAFAGRGAKSRARGRGARGRGRGRGR